MSKNLKVSIIQTDLICKNKKQNFKKIEALLNKKIDTDLILLPEMFNTAFYPSETKLAEPINSISQIWLKNISIKYDCAIAGTMMIKEEGKIYNRFVLIEKGKLVGSYNKRHLFSLSDEKKQLESGKELKIINYKGWKICPQICYDLRFPVYSRNKYDYDILIYLANWPEKRINAWDVLLKARSIENQCFTIGVNRVGTDSNGFHFPGHSNIIDPEGNSLIKVDSNECLKTISICKESIVKTRRIYPFLNDIDKFTIY